MQKEDMEGKKANAGHVSEQGFTLVKLNPISPSERCKTDFRFCPIQRAKNQVLPTNSYPSSAKGPFHGH